MSEKKREQIDPRNYTFKEGTTVEMDSQVFLAFLRFMSEELQKRPAKPYFLNHKPVVEKGKVVYKQFKNNKEYKEQQPLEMRDVDGVNYLVMNDLLMETFVDNIEKGNAITFEELEGEKKLKKVEE